MNPSHEDPNNHVPAVSPEDDWDDLVGDSKFDSQLPPRRPEQPQAGRKEFADAKSHLISVSPVVKEVNDRRFKKNTIDPEQKAKGASTGATANQDHEGEDLETVIKVGVNSVVSMDITGDRIVGPQEVFHASHIIEVDESVEKEPVFISPNHFIPGERDDWGAKRHGGSMRWLLYSSLGIVFLVALTVSLSQMSKHETVRESDKSFFRQIAPKELKPETSNEDLGDLAMLVNSKPQAIDIYSSYMSAETVSDFSQWVYRSESVLPLIQERWKPAGASKDWKLKDSALWETHENAGGIYAELSGVNHDFSDFLAYFRFESSELKMDWKATVGYGTASFAELKAGEGDSSEIRAWISLSDFHTGSLVEGKYRSFLIASPDELVSIWGYTEIGSEMDQKLSALFKQSQITGEFVRRQKVILSLERGQEGTLPSQWMVSRLVGINWIDQSS